MHCFEEIGGSGRRNAGEAELKTGEHLLIGFRRAGGCLQQLCLLARFTPNVPSHELSAQEARVWARVKAGAEAEKEEARHVIEQVG